MTLSVSYGKEMEICIERKMKREIYKIKVGHIIYNSHGCVLKGNSTVIWIYVFRVHEIFPIHATAVFPENKT